MPGPHPCLPRPPRPPPRDRSPPDGGKRWRRGGVQTAPARPCPTFFPSLPRKADRCPFLPQCRPPPAWTGATAAAGRAMRGGGKAPKPVGRRRRGGRVGRHVVRGRGLVQRDARQEIERRRALLLVDPRGSPPRRHLAHWSADVSEQPRAPSCTILSLRSPSTSPTWRGFFFLRFVLNNNRVR